MEGLQITLGVERRAFRRLIQANGWLMLEAVATTVRQNRRLGELKESKARRRQENIARNDAIRADAARGLTHGQVAKKLDMTGEAVRTVLGRNRQNARGKARGSA